MKAMDNRFTNRLSRIALVSAFAGMLWGCGIYGTFTAPEYEMTNNAYGDVGQEDTVSMGDIA